MSNSTPDRASGRIVWAIDPFADDLALHRRLMETIEVLRQGNSDVIEPVYVMSPDQLELLPRFFEVQAIDLRKKLESRAQEWVARFGIPNLLTPTVLVSHDMSLSSSVDTLLDYAGTTQASFIAVASHSRRGLARFLMGSFAESLVLRSEIPVLLITPRTRKIESLKRILFPTDLSAGSHETFRRLLPVAAAHHSLLVLFNAVELGTTCSLSEHATSQIFLRCLEEEIASRAGKLEQWASEARRAGVDCEISFRDSPGEVAGQSLEAAAHYQCDLIAMASQSNAPAAALSGSIARRTIRNADRPLWISHVQKESRRAELLAPSTERSLGTVII